MKPGSKEKKGVEGSPVDMLTDDILADIISRVPYKLTRRCKCVSRRWRDLISHPDYNKKMIAPPVRKKTRSFTLQEMFGIIDDSGEVVVPRRRRADVLILRRRQRQVRLE
ncbi:hypothetical protein QYE76_065790 [Lolium multiflorum]|uniref:F-box domain-containing protein n=1 Tax=Lolium multiflorum TaxID=4521 RepID=A0AAD8SBK6_LOLMU|nr:hypothetical protein QYE76_065790 [Lolium multiflorum]